MIRGLRLLQSGTPECRDCMKKRGRRCVYSRTDTTEVIPRPACKGNAADQIFWNADRRRTRAYSTLLPAASG